MNRSFEYITTLEYRLKAANAQILAFKSGEKYIRMQEEYVKERCSLEQKIRKLEDELSPYVRLKGSNIGNASASFYEIIRIYVKVVRFDLGIFCHSSF